MPRGDITTICSVLSISRDSACMLLRSYNWNVSNVHEPWLLMRLSYLLRSLLVMLTSDEDRGIGATFLDLLLRTTERQNGVLLRAVTMQLSLSLEVETIM